MITLYIGCTSESLIVIFLDLPLTAPTREQDRVSTHPLNTLLLEYQPDSITHFVQAEHTSLAVSLPAPRTLGAGLESVFSFS